MAAWATVLDQGCTNKLLASADPYSIYSIWPVHILQLAETGKNGSNSVSGVYFLPMNQEFQ